MKNVERGKKLMKEKSKVVPASASLVKSEFTGAKKVRVEKAGGKRG